MPDSPDVDRLSIRRRPGGVPIMHQTWDKLIFLHWRIKPEVLRRRVPARLEIDTYDGSAWIGVTPFTMRGVRPVFVPPLPRASVTHELNVRTYVLHGGVPGVWFFSLDASNPLAVFLARLGFSLPYYLASMSLVNEEAGSVRFTSERRHSDARFEAAWRLSGDVREAGPGSLEFFLIERYCLYALRRRSVRRARIFHAPWTLRNAELLTLHSTMIESARLPTPDGSPLIHAQAAALDVEVWPLKSL